MKEEGFSEEQAEGMMRVLNDVIEERFVFAFSIFFSILHSNLLLYFSIIYTEREREKERKREREKERKRGRNANMHAL